MQERYRTCNKIEPTDTDCGGDNVQQAECTVDSCPQAGKTFTSYANLPMCKSKRNNLKHIYSNI